MNRRTRLYVYRAKRSRKKRIAFFVCLILVVFILFMGMRSFFSKNTNTNSIISPIAEEFTLLNSLVSSRLRGETLDDVVDKALVNTKGRYSVAIKNLKTGETYYRNEDEAYQAASLYKLWIMATAYDQIQKGRLKEDDVLTKKVEDLNKTFRIASQSAELTEGEISFSVGSALTQMITISHNYAALILTDRIRLSTVQAFLKLHGLNDSSVGIDGSQPKTTAKDIGLFFEKLYNGELGTKDATQKMITTLKNQKLNSKLPKFLPENIEIAHKTGELFTFTHDAGIVYTPHGNYVIVVLSDTTYPPGAVDRIADMSKDVYVYFEKDK